MSDEQTYVGYTGATREYKDNPTIENYVNLRRSSPDEVIEVAVSSRFDWVLSNEQVIEGLGLDVRTVVDILDADLGAISIVCLHLLELIIAREKMLASGMTHVVGRGEAISDSLINHFVGLMLDSLDWNDFLEIPRDFIVLIRHQLGTVNSEIEKKQTAHDKKLAAPFVGYHLLENGQDPSYRNVARAMGVNPTTVIRWYPNNSLRGEIERIYPLMKLGKPNPKKQSQ